jgi:hypothetical protein
MPWPSATNMALGAITVPVALVERFGGLDPLAAFWIVLLAGLAAAIFALWSILYRPTVSIAAE